MAKQRRVRSTRGRLRLWNTPSRATCRRGGLKLEGALRDSGVDVTGLTCLDVGQSTLGGEPTRCLLQRCRAREVDVEPRPVAPAAAGRPHVTCLEKDQCPRLDATV